MSAKRPVRQSISGKRVTRSAWSRQVEQATLRAGDDDVLRDAKAAFDRIRDPALQMRLAYEIAETRARELCLAYKNVVMVAAGYRMKRAARGKTGIVKTPCVTFVVRRKWKGKGPAAQKQQLLPSHLLAYTGFDGARVLCAVPTDVVVEQGFARARPQAPSGIVADREVGNATCAAVMQSGNRRALVMLGCQHVLTPERSLNTPQPVEGTQVVLLDNPSVPLALTSSNGGQLRSDGSPSFDVQLTGPVDLNALRAALDGLALAPGASTFPTRAPSMRSRTLRSSAYWCRRTTRLRAQRFPQPLCAMSRTFREFLTGSSSMRTGIGKSYP